MAIKEDYCSFEVAKLLNEKGFNWDCITYYVDSEPNDIKYSMLFENNNTWEDRCCSAPTHQMACKWLREVHKVHISIYPFNRKLPITDEFYYTCDIATSKLSSKEGHLRGVWKTYEEAVEAALKYVLENLI